MSLQPIIQTPSPLPSGATPGAFADQFAEIDRLLEASAMGSRPAIDDTHILNENRLNPSSGPNPHAYEHAGAKSLQPPYDACCGRSHVRRRRGRTALESDREQTLHQRPGSLARRQLGVSTPPTLSSQSPGPSNSRESSSSPDGPLSPVPDTAANTPEETSFISRIWRSLRSLELRRYIPTFGFMRGSWLQRWNGNVDPLPSVDSRVELSNLARTEWQDLESGTGSRAVGGQHEPDSWIFDERNVDWLDRRREPRSWRRALMFWR
ncbi:hypothetical protein MMC28_010746 [Mycoblastus sanguinarius]|nr:hypothetical protein [Mycoblastus sanguinarius]